MSAAVITAARRVRAIASIAVATERPHTALAALALFMGLSAANAMGGLLQLLYFGLSLGILLLCRHRVPRSLLAATSLCGTVALLASLQGEAGVAPLLRFVRPCVEGYLLAILLFHGCRIRTLPSLLTALAGYVLVQLVCAVAMAASPDLRAALLDRWYGDDTYDSMSFQVALLFRGFGVSRHHLFGLPLALGTVGVMLLLGASVERRRLQRVLLISAAAASTLLIVVNARIGLVPLFLCYALGITLYFRAFLLGQLLVLTGIVLPLAWLVVRLSLGEVGEALVDWMVESALQFVDPSNAADATTASDLAGMVVLPVELRAWLIGDGRICQPEEGCYSDIGWIRLLQEGGLVLALPVAMLYVHLIVRIHDGLNRLGMGPATRRQRSSRALLLVVLLMTFLAGTIKGEAYAPNDYSRLLMMLAILMQQLPTRHRTAPGGSPLPATT